MGTTSDKLTYLNDTKIKIRDGINAIGGELDSEDTFRSYVEELESLYDEMPKVSATGTELTINNTRKGKMTTDLQPNTSQDGTPTPDAPIDIKVVTGDNTIKVQNKNLLNTSNVTLDAYFNSTTGAITTDTSHKNCVFNDYIKVKPNTQYTISTNSSTVASQFSVCEYKDNKEFFNYIPSGNWDYLSYTFTTSANASYIRIRYKYSNNDDITTQLINSLNLQLEEGQTSSTYVPHTEASYPINLGKNLFDKNSATYKNNYIKYDGGNDVATSGFGYVNSYIKVQPNTQYVLSGSIVDSTHGTRVYYYDSSKNWISRTNSFGNGVNICQFTTPNNCYYIQFQYLQSAYDSNTIQIEKGSQVTPYSSYFTPIEYCVIGDNKDKIAKSTGKNLFNISTINVGKYVNLYGTLTDSSYTNTSDYIEVKANQTYTTSWDYNTLSNDGTREIAFYDSSKTFIERITNVSMQDKSKTFTPSQDGYIRFDYDKNCYDIQMEKGNKTSFEPFGFGTSWYIKKSILEVIYNGSESGWGNSSTYNSTFTIDKPSLMNTGETNMLSNYFSDFKSSVAQLGNYGIAVGSKVNIKNIDITDDDTQGFKTWLSTHNVKIKYPATTPTYTILPSELQTQLDNLSKALSYDEQTNISQVNDDLPFILDISALKDISNL